MIQGIGKGGNPHTMQVSPNMCVGVGTECISGEGLIATAGAVDLAACLSQSSSTTSQSFYLSALQSGITTMFGIKMMNFFIYLSIQLFIFNFNLKV